VTNCWRAAWLALGVSVGGFACWTLHDLKTDVKNTTAGVRESNALVKEKLPPILDNSKRAGDSLVKVTDDIAAIRNLISPAVGDGGGKGGPVALAKFADKVLLSIQSQDVMVHSKGSGSKKAAEWVKGERKEALSLAFSVNSKRELLDKMCHTAFGNPWMVSADGKGGEPMRAWLLHKYPDIEKELDE
jgi:hypothetical protein